MRQTERQQQHPHQQQRSFPALGAPVRSVPVQSGSIRGDPRGNMHASGHGNVRASVDSTRPRRSQAAVLSPSAFGPVRPLSRMTLCHPALTVIPVSFAKLGQILSKVRIFLSKPSF